LAQRGAQAVPIRRILRVARARGSNTSARRDDGLCGSIKKMDYRGVPVNAIPSSAVIYFRNADNPEL
jgi:hypothetical protein